MSAATFFQGMALGLSIAAPVGPIGLLCLRRSIAQGRLIGFVSGLGAATADALYGCVAGFGLTAISGFLVAQQFGFGLIGGAFLVWLGVRTWRSEPAAQPAELAAGDLVAAYVSTLGLTLTNPLTILSFAVIFAGMGLGADAAATSTGAGAGTAGRAFSLVAGVFFGSAAWWLFLSTTAGLLRERLAGPPLRWINRASGALLTAFGLWQLLHLHATPVPAPAPVATQAPAKKPAPPTNGPTAARAGTAGLTNALAGTNAPAGDLAETNPPPGMVWIPAGSFQMGRADGPDDERPVHRVTVKGFWIDRTEVTNEEFERFVEATGYITTAERSPDPRLFPNADPALLVPGSVCFNPPPQVDSLADHLAWWEYRPGANWRHPEGPQSDIAARAHHPVVHVCWDDAVAYAKWAGKRLPTEAEWEYAARGGLEAKPFTWGDAVCTPKSANIWQGEFPVHNSAEDGWVTTAPVGSYPANGYGLVDMAGNVWEWVADWYRPDAYARSGEDNPTGPSDSFDPAEPGLSKRVMRGGSFLCSDVYCSGYRPAARMKSSPDTGLQHTGFRCVRDGVAPAAPEAP